MFLSSLFCPLLCCGGEFSFRQVGHSLSYCFIYLFIYWSVVCLLCCLTHFSSSMFYFYFCRIKSSLPCLVFRPSHFNARDQTIVNYSLPPPSTSPLSITPSPPHPTHSLTASTSFSPTKENEALKKSGIDFFPLKVIKFLWQEGGARGAVSVLPGNCLGHGKGHSTLCHKEILNPYTYWLNRERNYNMSCIEYSW